MDWIEIVARFLSFWLDKVVYGFIPTVYNILTDIAETTIFSEDIINLFASKIYALLGIFMLFKVSFSILTYIVDPDAFLDKSKGFSKLISNIIITLVLLVLTPWIFSQAMEIQSIVLRDNIIGSLFSVTGTDATSNGDPGNKMAYETFKAFYHIDTNLFPECESGESSALADPTGCSNKLGLTGDRAGEWTALEDTLNYAYNTNSVSIYMDYDLLNLKDQSDEFVFYYLPVISTVCGVVILLLLIVFCFDIAVRSIKLGFLNVIAPIPIISRLDPKKGKDIFDKWVKTCLSTYLDLFIRLLAIYFAVFIISQVIDLKFVSLETGTSKDVDAFVKVFIILGALMFAKQFPKLIEDITGVKMDGKFTLNPLKKLSQVPLMNTALGGVVGATTGAVGNFMANRQLGHGMAASIGSGVLGLFSGMYRGGRAGMKNEGKSLGIKDSLDAARKGAEMIYKRQGTTFFGRNLAGFQQAIGVNTEADTMEKEIKEYEDVVSKIDSIFKQANSEMVKYDNLSFVNDAGNQMTIKDLKNEKERLNALRSISTANMNSAQLQNHLNAITSLQTSISKNEKLAEQAYIDSVQSKVIKDVTTTAQLDSLDRIIANSTNSTVKKVSTSSGASLKDGRDTVRNTKVTVENSAQYQTAKANKKYKSSK